VGVSGQLKKHRAMKKTTRRKILIGLAITIGIGIIVYIVRMITIFSAFGAFDKDYSVTELKENFEKNKTEILELKQYFNDIVPKNKFVEIEFKDNNTLYRFGINTLGSSKSPMFLEWDLKTNTSRMDSIIVQLGWTRETFKTIKAKLDKADCIQIESGEPTKIGFKRSGMGMYSFNVFNHPIPDSLKANYNDSCTYILAGEKLVLEYAGGAVGPQCFYKLK